MNDLCSLVVCGAPLAGRAHEIAAELVSAGWSIQVLATPAAGGWLDVAACRTVTRRDVVGLSDARAERGPRAVVVAPITFNTAGKLAQGIADTPAHSLVAEALGAAVPILAIPTVNETLSSNPAWERNCALLTAAGVTWVSVFDGTAGSPRPVVSGTGDQLVAAFEPAWLTTLLPERA